MKYQSSLKHTKLAPRRGRVRAYASPLRAEQAAQTRVRIIRAYGDEVCSSDSGDITIQRVAARAGVSVPTLYRNFGSLDELGDAFWAWLEPQLGSLDAIEGADDLPPYTERLFKEFDERESLLRAMLLTRPGRRLRDRSIQRRNQVFQRALAPLTKRLPEREARAVTAVCKVLSGGHVWQLMREDWGLDGIEAGRAAAWTLRVLIEALRRNPTTLNGKERS